MSGPVDVLAVMDTDGRAVALYADTCSEGGLRKKQWQAHLAKHDEARAAVAELMASADAALSCLDATDDFPCTADELRFALAACRGDA